MTTPGRSILDYKHWIARLLVVVLALTMMQSAAQAKRRQYTLPDGAVVTIEKTLVKTFITINGEPRSLYRLECSTDLIHWTTFRNNINLGKHGTFTCIDPRQLSRCFYRVVPLRRHPRAEHGWGNPHN
ncbi:MAG: hypothetical protein L0Y58_11105 [Verrucomicrobia subdivision 3 bacterium]|nr:hypothetical protein [Limisphaerales bacterium]